MRGTLVFRPPVEILPKTRRTEEMQKRKIVTWERLVVGCFLKFFYLLPAVFFCFCWEGMEERGVWF